MELPAASDLEVPNLGPCSVESPLSRRSEHFVDDNSRVLIARTREELGRCLEGEQEPPAFEAAGPRSRLFFEPREVICGIVTCGGLCPGVNDVIRSLVLTATHAYGVRRIHGFRYGYAGLAATPPRAPLVLDPREVETIHRQGGTLLGSSRGHQDVSEMVDTLERMEVSLLFAIGGDGTMKGVSALCEEIARRHLPVSVIGIPKTIDNDLVWTERSFGYATAVEEAQAALGAAHNEAWAAWNGVGLVKLMGRHSGFIAAASTLSSGDVNFTLVPEVPFALEGDGGFLAALEERLRDRHHAVVVVAEGAGQDLIDDGGEEQRDASGNVKLHDIGPYLRQKIRDYCAAREMPVDVKYIDPSYTIRSRPANSFDSEFCLILGQHAVHAGMAGRTDTMIGFWSHRFTHVPLRIAAGRRKQLDPRGEMWQRVLDTTGQPRSLGAAPAAGE